MSKSLYIRSKSLHALATFAPTTQRIQVGNGQYVAVLFIIPVIIEVYGHRFEAFTLVSEIHDNEDLVLGMKNAYELEGIIDTQDSSFRFLNRSIPFFSKEQGVVKPKEKKFIKIEALFVGEISGLAIVKMLDSKEQCTVVLKLKFIRNCASLDVTNIHKNKTKNKFFDNIAIDIFLFIAAIISMLAIIAIIHIVCKHVKLKTLLTGIAFQPIKQTEAAVTNQTQQHCMVQWYAVAALTLMIVLLIIYICLTTQRCTIFKQRLYSNTVTII